MAQKKHKKKKAPNELPEITLEELINSTEDRIKAPDCLGYELRNQKATLKMLRELQSYRVVMAKKDKVKRPNGYNYAEAILRQEAIKEGTRQAIEDVRFHQKVGMLLQMCQDTSLIALDETAQELEAPLEPEVVRMFLVHYVSTANEFARMMDKGQDDDREYWYTQETVDSRLKSICGPYFEPWQVRYGKEALIAKSIGKQDEDNNEHHQEARAEEGRRPYLQQHQRAGQ